MSYNPPQHHAHNHLSFCFGYGFYHVEMPNSYIIKVFSSMVSGLCVIFRISTLTLEKNMSVICSKTFMRFLFHSIKNSDPCRLYPVIWSEV